MANTDIFQPKDTAEAASSEKIASLLEPYKRTAWFPQTVERCCALEASKFSGVPFLADSEDWPCCEHCKQPLQLFLQLNSKHLPEQAGQPFGEGYLQVFYCTNWDQECEIECEAYLPFSKSTLIRVAPFGTISNHKYTTSPVAEAFPEKEITGWSAEDDYPNPDELEILGCKLTKDQRDILYDQDYPLSKDKLLGWPYWVQNVEYPDCPECGEPMQLIFQIDSDDNLPYMFGDTGCAHITQCKTHPHIMAIAWACC